MAAVLDQFIFADLTPASLDPHNSGSGGADMLPLFEGLDFDVSDEEWQMFAAGNAAAASPDSNTSNSSNSSMVDSPFPDLALHGDFDEDGDDSSSTTTTTTLQPGMPKRPRAAVRKCHAATVEEFMMSLTAQEQRMLVAEGTKIPTHGSTLLKSELRELKAGLRKVRNKLAAQVSRERKHVYVADLEARVEHVTVLNIGLQDRVQSLERDNKSLLQQLRELQQRLGLQQRPAHAGTCLMLLGLCFALCAAPPSATSGDGWPLVTVAVSVPAAGLHHAHGRALKSFPLPAPPAPAAATALAEALWQALWVAAGDAAAAAEQPTPDTTNWTKMDDVDDSLEGLRRRVLPLRFRAA